MGRVSPAANGRPLTFAADVLDEHARTTARRIAIDVDGLARITYGAWNRRANQLARALQRRGAAPGDRMVICMSSASFVDYAVAYFAVHRAGAIAVPVAPESEPEDVARVFEDTEPRWVLGGPESAAVLPRALGASRVKPTAWIAGGAPGFEDFRAFEAAETDGYVPVPRSESDVADIVHTPGTMGAPKGVVSTHADIMHLARNPIAAQFPGARFFHAFPPTTFIGTHWTLLLALSGALTSITQPLFDAARFLDLVEEHGVSIAYLAPSALRLALELCEARERACEGLVLLLYGGEPMDPTTIHRVRATFSRAMQLNIYNLTEGGAATCMLSPAEALRRSGSVGRPVPPTAATVRDDTGSASPVGARGEVWLRSAARRSYHRDEQATTRTWTEDGWLRTGDIGHLDGDGYLYVDGRAEEVIRHGEHTIYPNEVEAVLLEHPGVREAKVVGAALFEPGENVTAFIVPRSGARVTADEIAAHCADRLIAEKRPNLVEIVETLPRNLAGKISTRELTSRRSLHPR